MDNVIDIPAIQAAKQKAIDALQELEEVIKNSITINANS